MVNLKTKPIVSNYYLNGSFIINSNEFNARLCKIEILGKNSKKYTS